MFGSPLQHPVDWPWPKKSPVVFGKETTTPGWFLPSSVADQTSMFEMYSSRIHFPWQMEEDHWLVGSIDSENPMFFLPNSRTSSQSQHITVEKNRSCLRYIQPFSTQDGSKDEFQPPSIGSKSEHNSTWAVFSHHQCFQKRRQCPPHRWSGKHPSLKVWGNPLGAQKTHNFFRD